jgi:hypothetical protein
MKFTIAQRDLVKMLKHVTSKQAVSKKNRDTDLRIEACDGLVTMTANESEAQASATIHKKGVCYIRYRSLLPIIRTFAGTLELSIEIEPDGLLIGSFRISDGIWVALFDNPATAPKRLIGREDPALSSLADGDASIQAWREFYSKG